MALNGTGRLCAAAGVCRTSGRASYGCRLGLAGLVMLCMPWLYAGLAGVLLATHGGTLLYGHFAGVRASEARHEAARQAIERRLFRAADDLSARAFALTVQDFLDQLRLKLRRL